jgi:hypothetical protein
MSSRTHQKRQCRWLWFGGGRHGGLEGNDSKPSLVTEVTVWCHAIGTFVVQPKRFFKKKQQHPVKFRHSAGKRFFQLKSLSRELLASGHSGQKEMKGAMTNWTSDH